MANVCSVSFKKLDQNNVLAILQKINDERFASLLQIQLFDDCIEISLKENNTNFSSMLWFENKSKNKLEWKHHYSPLWWWTISTITSKMIREINPRARIRDEGISETIEPNFDSEYPKPDDWFQPMPSHNFAIKMANKMITRNIIKKYKKMLPVFFKAAQNN